MRTVTIPQWGDVLCGNTISESATRGYKVKQGDFDRWTYALQATPGGASLLAATESAQEFFSVEKDMAMLIPSAEWEEAFYSLKNGFSAPNCPASFIYFAKAIYKQYNICNLIVPLFPLAVNYRIHKRDYFGAGYTGQDAIRNFVNPDFQAITSDRPLVKCGNWYEVYVPNTDMVAALPLKLGQMLSQENARCISFSPKVGLTIEGQPLTALAGYQGVSRSHYDLRGVI